MLRMYGFGTKEPLDFDLASRRLPPNTNWVDAFDPDEAEIAFLAQIFGVSIPTLASLEEIESSSRLATDGHAILMSFAVTLRDEVTYCRTSPIGFVLTKDCVLTVRFARLNSFGNLNKQLAEKGNDAEGGVGALVTILEIFIDYLADQLEGIGKELDGASRRIFAQDMMAPAGRKPRQSNEAMKAMLQTIGRSGDLGSTISQSLLGLNRMVPYIINHASYVKEAESARLDIVALDAKSLNEYDQHLTDKAQFLLDTLLGLANIEQNNVFRVLTVVSVIGIPPTFLASMWGMNFKSMPELDWPRGYAVALTAIFISAIGPAVWFKVKGWW